MKIGSNYLLPARRQSPNFAATLTATDKGKERLKETVELWIEDPEFQHLEPFNFEKFFDRLAEIFKEKTQNVKGTVNIDEGPRQRAILSFIPEKEDINRDQKPQFMNTIEGNILLPKKEEKDPKTGQYEPQIDQLIHQLYLMESSREEKNNFFEAFMGLRD